MTIDDAIARTIQLRNSIEIWLENAKMCYAHHTDVRDTTENARRATYEVCGSERWNDLVMMLGEADAKLRKLNDQVIPMLHAAKEEVKK